MQGCTSPIQASPSHKALITVSVINSTLNKQTPDNSRNAKVCKILQNNIKILSERNKITNFAQDIFTQQSYLWSKNNAISNAQASPR